MDSKLIIDFIKLCMGYGYAISYINETSTTIGLSPIPELCATHPMYLMEKLHSLGYAYELSPNNIIYVYMK